MSDIETVINASKQIEKMLELRLGATGRGLHEKVSSVEAHLPGPIVKRMRFIASVRNGVVHGDVPMIRDRAGFEAAVSEVTEYLRELALAPTGRGQGARRARTDRERETRRSPVLAWLLALLVIAMAVATWMNGQE